MLPYLLLCPPFKVIIFVLLYQALNQCDNIVVKNVISAMHMSALVIQYIYSQQLKRITLN